MKTGTGDIKMSVKTYSCEFPCCTYKTTSRDRMDYHHIVPRSMPNTSNKPFNRIWLCPEHHRAIFVPGMTSGHHAIKNPDSIILVAKRTSTHGNVLEYERGSDSRGYYYFYQTHETWDR